MAEGKTVEWQCRACGHRWKGTLRPHRTRPPGCPECYNMESVIPAEARSSRAEEEGGRLPCPVRFSAFFAPGLPRPLLRDLVDGPVEFDGEDFHFLVL